MLSSLPTSNCLIVSGDGDGGGDSGIVNRLIVGERVLLDRSYSPIKYRVRGEGQFLRMRADQNKDAPILTQSKSQ